MWEYTYPSYETSQDELYHYGVKGMKWGVRRATKRLSKATTKEDRDKAVASLQKHRAKASAEIVKLDKQRPKLEKAVNRHIMKNDEKAIALKEKSARLQNKAYGRFTSKDRAGELLYKAGKLDARANAMSARSEKAKAMLAKNDTMRDAFQNGIKDIDKTIRDAGKMKFEQNVNLYGDDKLFAWGPNKTPSKKGDHVYYEKLKDGSLRFVDKSIDGDTQKRIKSIEAKYDKKLRNAKDEDEIDNIENSRLFEIDDLLYNR